MANSVITHEAVKSICDKLECSPSQHDESGKYGGAPNIEPTAKGTEAVTKNTRGDHTSEFHMKDRGNSLPNYKGQFAKKPQHV